MLTKYLDKVERQEVCSNLWLYLLLTSFMSLSVHEMCICSHRHVNIEMMSVQFPVILFSHQASPPQLLEPSRMMRNLSNHCFLGNSPADQAQSESEACGETQVIIMVSSGESQVEEADRVIKPEHLPTTKRAQQPASHLFTGHVITLD